MYHFILQCSQTSQNRLSDRNRWGIFWMRGRSMGWEMPFLPCKSKWWRKEKCSLRLSNFQHLFPCYSLACYKLIASHKTDTESHSYSIQTITPFFSKSESSLRIQMSITFSLMGWEKQGCTRSNHSCVFSESFHNHLTNLWILLHQRCLDGAGLLGL